ncbi:MAG: hypothetical protein LBK60_00285 [Verrucomicrobiales bacterium]|jgi:hypothetical protein|nr:hypothetical protein [Verrucomicrobiales bacterium]
MKPTRKQPTKKTARCKAAGRYGGNKQIGQLAEKLQRATGAHPHDIFVCTCEGLLLQGGARFFALTMAADLHERVLAAANEEGMTAALWLSRLARNFLDARDAKHQAADTAA